MPSDQVSSRWHITGLPAPDNLANMPHQQTDGFGQISYPYPPAECKALWQNIVQLTQRSGDTMASILQRTYSDAFS